MHRQHKCFHLYLISSKRASPASDNDIHFGTHSPEIFSQSQELGVGISGLSMQLVAHILACKAAFITSRYNASCADGLFSRFSLFWHNISRRASFTFSWVLTRSYKTQDNNKPIILNCQDSSSHIEKGLCITQRNDSVTISTRFPGFSCN